MRALLAVCCLVLVTHSLAKELPKDPETPNRNALDLDRLPENTVGLVGSTVTLTCGAQGSLHQIYWYEFASSPQGSLISINDVVGVHPERDRYAIIHRDPFEYTLEISNLKLTDGGDYQCLDQNANVAEKRFHIAKLTVIAVDSNCTTTIRENGIVLEGAYTTNDCLLEYQGGIIPNMTWSGIGPFNQVEVATAYSVWAGMAFNSTRAMDTRAHQCTIFFTGHFLPVDGNRADNVPTWSRVHQSRQMFIYWGPQGTTITPIKATYEPGEILTCTTDAFPPASLAFYNLRTSEIFIGNTIVVGEDWRTHNTTVRCEAQNVIEGTTYPANVFAYVYVPPITTPTTTTPTTTTTPPPPVAPCQDLTGAWISVSPTRASLCIRLDLSQNAVLNGLLLNDTDTYWVDIIGRAQYQKFDQVGFSGIWPLTIGVSSFAGECHRCFGVEQLLVNVVSKSKGEVCGERGPLRYTSQYVFRRADDELRCPNVARGLRI